MNTKKQTDISNQIHVIEGSNHPRLSIPLDNLDGTITDRNIANFATPKTVCHTITSILELLSKPKHCANCGALIPELGFTYKGKEYVFTCYEVWGRDRLVAETTYQKLAHWITTSHGEEVEV
jgi:hypothetical protein